MATTTQRKSNVCLLLVYTYDTSAKHIQTDVSQVAVEADEPHVDPKSVAQATEVCNLDFSPARNLVGVGRLLGLHAGADRQPTGCDEVYNVDKER